MSDNAFFRLDLKSLVSEFCCDLRLVFDSLGMHLCALLPAADDTSEYEYDLIGEAKLCRYSVHVQLHFEFKANGVGLKLAIMPSPSSENMYLGWLM